MKGAGLWVTGRVVSWGRREPEPGRRGRRPFVESPPVRRVHPGPHSPLQRSTSSWRLTRGWGTSLSSRSSGVTDGGRSLWSLSPSLGGVCMGAVTPLRQVRAPTEPVWEGPGVRSCWGCGVPGVCTHACRGHLAVPLRVPGHGFTSLLSGCATWSCPRQGGCFVAGPGYWVRSRNPDTPTTRSLCPRVSHGPLCDLRCRSPGSVGRGVGSGGSATGTSSEEPSSVLLNKGNFQNSD